ncbi:heat shock factor-binding protein-like [Curcuma longa]|uniref:heat shock factor-binding protein-like n=1 Tax=Curcuma longa TaxID=136217 RepID=UPI003D9F7516
MASTNPVAPKASDHESEGSVQSTADMTAFVQNLLVQMQTRFQAMSEGIVAKIDEMGSKIDELEKSISDLKAEMDAEPTAKSNLEEGKPSDESS